MKIFIIVTILIASLFDFLLKYLTYKSANNPLSESVSDIYDPVVYEKRNKYEAEKIRHSIYLGVTALVFSIIVFVFNIHHKLYAFFSNNIEDEFLKSALMIAVIGGIDFIISIPFNAYETFKIEGKYDFNNTTVKVFIGDVIKKMLLIIVLGGLLLYLFFIVYESLGNFVFIIFYFVLVGLSLLITLLARYFMKLFNKFIPLEDNELKQMIVDYTNKVKFSIKNIYIMNASLRSNKVNAFFSGFGKTKSIVLYDTLLDKCTNEEIVAILAHEAGHAKHKHILINFFSSLFTTSLILLGAYFVVTRKEISTAFGFENVNILFNIMILFEILALFIILLGIPKNYISRKFEYQADRFASTSYDEEAMKKALKTLAKANFANLSPNPFVVKLTYSHPPIKDRIDYINSLK